MHRLFWDRKLQCRGYEFSQWLVDTIIFFTIQPTIHEIDNKQKMETKPTFHEHFLGKKRSRFFGWTTTLGVFFCIRNWKVMGHQKPSFYGMQCN